MLCCELKKNAAVSVSRQIQLDDEPGVSIRLYAESEFDSLKEPWQRLDGYSTSPSVFRGWAWNRLWWKHYGHLGELHLLVVTVDDTIQCIAPFYKTTVRFLGLQPVAAIKFIGTGGDTSPDDLDVLYNPQFVDITLHAVCDALHSLADVSLYQLSDMPTSSAFLRRFLTCSEARMLPLAQIRKQKRLVMPLCDSMDAYLATLTRNTRKRTKSRLRKLAESGAVHFEYCTTAHEIEQMVGELTRLNHARHDRFGQSESFKSSNYIQFHMELMQQLLPLGQLRLMQMQYGKKVIGVEYGFQIGGTLSFFQTGFDPAHEDLSPGHSMMLHMIEESIHAGAAQIDLLKGNYDYKSSYAKMRKTTLNIDLWKNSVHSNVKAIMGSLRYARLTPPWRKLLSENESY